MFHPGYSPVWGIYCQMLPANNMLMLCIRLLGACETKGDLFIIMEYLEGGTLVDLLSSARFPRIPVHINLVLCSRQMSAQHRCNKSRGRRSMGVSQRTVLGAAS